MKSHAESNSPPRPSHAAERMYVMWFVSWIALLLLVILLYMIGSDRMKRQADTLREQSGKLTQLEEELTRLRQDFDGLSATPPVVGAVEPAEPHKPSDTTQGNEAADSDLDVIPNVAPDEPLDVEALLSTAFSDTVAAVAELRDVDAARTAVDLAMGAVADADWDGQTWSKLAIAARLLDRDAPAEMFALKALAAGIEPAEYYEISARRLLARGEPTEAADFAIRLVRTAPTDQGAALLLAEIQFTLGDPGAVAEALDGITDARQLTVPETLRVGRLLIYSEQWRRLEDVVAKFVDPPPEALPELNRLRAVVALKGGRLPEALALIDGLLESDPNDYDLLTWRGVALLEAQEYSAAREALEHARQQPDRAEALYWLAVVELRVGDSNAAVEHLQRALAANADYPPALETLATIALNSGDVSTAADYVADSIAANPRRASAHFLQAITSAKLLRADEAYGALRRALELEPGLFETAQNTDVLRELITQQQWRELAEIAGAPAD